MREITRRNALGIIAASGMSASVAGATKDGGVTSKDIENSKFDSIARPDMTVLNNTEGERDIFVSLRDDTVGRVPVLEKRLAGVLDAVDAQVQQESRSNLTVPREGTYTVEVAVDDEVTAERSFGLSERGLPDNQSILIDVDSEETTIALSVV